MNDIISSLDQLISASLKKQAAEAPTTLPKTDDGNVPAVEKARSSENTSDVKAQVPGQPVDATGEGEASTGPGGESTATNDIGTKAAPTGEDASVETSSVKSKPEDPGTSHPAKADNGEKYSAAELLGIGDEILAEIAVAAERAATKSAELPPALAAVVADKKEETPAEEKKEEKAEEKDEKKEDDKDEQAGKDAAAAVVETLELGHDKIAQLLDQVVKSAELDAANVADYLAGYATKVAEMGAEQVPPELAGALEGQADAGPVAAEAAPAEAGAEGEDAQLEAILDELAQQGISIDDLLAAAGDAGQGEAEVVPEGTAAEEVPAEAEADKVASVQATAADKAAKLSAIKTAFAQLRKQKGG